MCEYAGMKRLLKSSCEFSTFLLVSMIFLFGALEILTVISPVQGIFNHTKCPAPWELQSDTVKKNFSIKKFEGSYHELALHDYTQFPICPAPKCMRSHKVMNYTTNQINDTFTLNCFGSDYSFTFLFNLTNTTGFFLGRVVHFPDVIFPDTVVDVKEGPDGVYEWAIEFQCVEKLDHIWFVGINWYSRQANVTDEYYESMINAARARGLGYFMDSGFKVTLVDQNCTKKL